jgi:aspartokinase/homoserine dehydrogenase 1
MLGITYLAGQLGATATFWSTNPRQNSADRTMKFLASMARAVEIFLFGPGLVGGTLLQQIKKQQPVLHAQGVDVRVLLIANSRRLIFNADGLDLATFRDDLQASTIPSSVDFIIDRTKEGSFVAPVFVDCTATFGTVPRYLDLFRAGLHIVTANKRANAQPYSDYLALREVANAAGRRFLYETNVGAGLPVIDTLQSLVTTGDELVELAGIASGSLSFIFGLFDDGVKFSDALEQAKVLGYTEPDPRDDLLCEDVVRKLIIVARETGYPVNREDIEITPILPETFDAGGSVTDFVARLPQLDEYFAARVAAAKDQNKVFRVALEIKDGKCKVGIVEVGPEHPMYTVKNGDQIFVFKTKRYTKVPLVIKGAGAGAEVTAAGVFSDILRLVSWNPIQKSPSVQ